MSSLTLYFRLSRLTERSTPWVSTPTAIVAIVGPKHLHGDGFIQNSRAHYFNSVSTIPWTPNRVRYLPIVHLMTHIYHAVLSQSAAALNSCHEPDPCASIQVNIYAKTLQLRWMQSGKNSSI